MDIRTFVSTSVLAIAVGSTPAVSQTAAPAQTAPGYAWADSCQSCHPEIYDAWAKTKHATALDRLSSTEQEQPCVECHVTGLKARVIDGRKVLNRGVQCEACHGAGAAHVANGSVIGLVKTPAESLCVECHSSKSPKFKGFYYAGMAAFSHKVK
jgi:predicted CXXCH cytochrome family protein